MKHALLIVFSYSRDSDGNSLVTPIQGSLNDLIMMVDFCEKKCIPFENITIITDIFLLPVETERMNVKIVEMPSCSIVCQHIVSFVENTIQFFSQTKIPYGSNPEIFLYFSCHGSELIVENPESHSEQGIVLFNDECTTLRYLTTEDIFNILFGRIPISQSGSMRIPIYSKLTYTEKENYGDLILYSEKTDVCLEHVSLSLTTPKRTPSFGFANYRTSYMLSRGIPSLSHVLIIGDMCHSGNITHFPFVYCPKKENFIESPHFNRYVDHFDTPYCVCISSCSIKTKTRSIHSGSHLTKTFYDQFKNSSLNLNCRQIYYYLTEFSTKNLINSLSLGKLSPVITSTRESANFKIPFFGSENLKPPRKIIKS